MTNRIARFLTPLLMLPFPALAADQVVLTNGDTITGAIVKKDGAKLTIKSEFLGEVTMPWSAVKSIRSDAELNVVLPGGQTVKGKLSTAGDQLQVAAGAETKTAPLAAVATVRDAAEQHSFERLEHPRILELWNGNFDIGLALTSGNARSDSLTTAFTAGRRTRGGNFTVYFNQIHSTARVDQVTKNPDGTVLRVDKVTSTIASALRGGWKYNRNVSSRMFVTGFNDYEHDSFQNLNIRFVAGGGAGVRALKTENAQLDVDAGFDYQRENFLDGQIRNSAEANFGDNLLYKVFKGTSITQAMRVFNNLSDTGTYRMNFDLGSSTLLKRWLGWHVTASDRFLSNPVQGRQRNDLILSTGFRLTFAK
jgi:putative salt-induced outer membrane protein YdiY